MTIEIGSNPLKNVMELRPFKRRRVSSYDRTGGNKDNLTIKPGEKRVIFDVKGPGCITHIWTTQACRVPFFPRHIIIRMWWDGEKLPSVECPLGDFFGLGHGDRRDFNSAPLQMSPQAGKGMNCWWPMPFRHSARIEIEYDVPKGGDLTLYYYVDYEVYEKWPETEHPLGYFHAHFHREIYSDMESDPDTGKEYKYMEWQFSKGHNTRENGGYDRNHLILHAKGKGQYAGCHIDIDNKFRFKSVFLLNWPGEGDDMIFIDEDVGGEPTLYGTGTEDYVNTAYGPWSKYDAPYHGIIRGDWVFRRKYSVYRYHIPDPVSFEKEIKVTIEHGHNNHRGDIWETTAYWYQVEPHMPLPPLPKFEERTPRKPWKGLKWFLGGAAVVIIALVVIFSYLI